MFDSKMKLADVVRSNYSTLNVINRFGIELGFGDRTVYEVCEDNQLDAEFFLEILNAFHDENYFPQEHLQHFSVSEIVGYLRMTHQEYIQRHIPYIESLLDELEYECSNPDELKLVHNLFNEYKEELFKHLQWEDEQIFPYVIEVENAFKGIVEPDAILARINQYSMKRFIEDHTDIESALSDINTLLVKYLPPVHNQFLCIRILKELAILERDINNHSRIEDKVLTPKVIKLEEEIIEKYGKN